VRVAVFSLEVDIEMAKWKEQRQRRKQWLTRQQAATLIDEPELVSLIEGFTPV
jgi:hypothetical protein